MELNMLLLDSKLKDHLSILLDLIDIGNFYQKHIIGLNCLYKIYGLVQSTHY